jgi:hypothetical protein
VVRAECLHAGDPLSNPRLGWPMYIWMHTPSVVTMQIRGNFSVCQSVCLSVCLSACLPSVLHEAVNRPVSMSYGGRVLAGLYLWKLIKLSPS